LTADIAAEVPREAEQRARSAFSLALCALLDHGESPDLVLDQVAEFATHLRRAQVYAVHAPSSQGPFADSMAIHHLGLELVEEIWQLARLGPVEDKKRELVEAVACLLQAPSHGFRLSPLRQRMLHDARWRLRELNPRWNACVPETSAFPARNRFLNFRSAINASPGSAEPQRLLRMWRRFDSRGTLAPCRMAIALPPSSEAAEALWMESKDISMGGKHYFAWLRDRYYLDDGFGPMLLRANFALMLGFAKVHETVRRGDVVNMV
jgi:hypothetical protein